MSTPLTKSSGAITTTGIAISTGPGVVSYAQASTAAAVRLYDGTSSDGVFLAGVPISGRQQFNPPVQFQTGLWVVPQSTVGSSAGSESAAAVHYS
jgi:hypothetical protein